MTHPGRARPGMTPTGAVLRGAFSAIAVLGACGASQGPAATPPPAPAAATPAQAPKTELPAEPAPVAGAIAWAKDLYLKAKRPIIRFKKHSTGLLEDEYGASVKVIIAELLSISR